VAGNETQTDERSLIVRAQSGDRDSFGVLVRLYLTRVYRAAYGIVRNHDDASDIAQDAFVRAYKNLNRFDVSKPLYPWLFRIARNLALNRIERLNKREVSLPEFDTVRSAHKMPDEVVVARDEKERVRAAVSRLPDQHKEIIELCHFQECSYKEMAEILDIPIGTVMSRLYHARQKLKDLLLSDEGAL
jgi:RNA polymerase sigma-70 factor (ECF subfamily)